MKGIIDEKGKFHRMFTIGFNGEKWIDHNQMAVRLAEKGEIDTYYIRVDNDDMCPLQFNKDIMLPGTTYKGDINPKVIKTMSKVLEEMYPKMSLAEAFEKISDRFCYGSNMIEENKLLMKRLDEFKNALGSKFNYEKKSKCEVYLNKKFVSPEYKTDVTFPYKD